MSHQFEKTEFDAYSGVTGNLKHSIFNKLTKHPIPLAHDIGFPALSSSKTGVNLFNKAKANSYIRGHTMVSSSEDMNVPFSIALIPQTNGIRRDRFAYYPPGINLRGKCPEDLKPHSTWTPLRA